MARKEDFEGAGAYDDGSGRSVKSRVLRLTSLRRRVLDAAYSSARAERAALSQGSCTTSVRCQTVSAIIIIVNAVMIGVEADSPGLIEWNFNVRSAFLTIYILELFLNMGNERLIFFCDMWNLLDLAIIITTVFCFWVWPALAVSDRHAELAIIFGQSALLFRTVRILRLSRLSDWTAFKAIGLLIHSILRSFKALQWLTILIFVLVYMVSVITTMLFAPGQPYGDIAADGYVPPYFSTVTSSMWFFFRVMMGSESNDIDELFAWSPLFKFVYFVMKVLTAWFGLAFLIAIVSENMFGAASHEKARERFEREHRQRNQLFSFLEPLQVGPDGNMGPGAAALESLMSPDKVDALRAVLEIPADDILEKLARLASVFDNEDLIVTDIVECLISDRAYDANMSEKQTDILKRRHDVMQSSLIHLVKESIRKGDESLLEVVSDLLVVHGWKKEKVAAMVSAERKSQSRGGGISAAYLISEEFLTLARQRSGLEEPTFHDLKASFFLSSDALGATTPCPRDGLPGCALIDYFPRRHRGRCTHFLSWTWLYRVSMVQEAIRDWLRCEDLDPERTFLFVCFFVNNQYRILRDREGDGSRDLEAVFEETLLRCKNVVALLDTWDSPRYLTRIWTIYEQFTALRLRLPMQMILPPDAHRSLIGVIEQGKVGIQTITDALLKVDAENAKAWSLEDMLKVKRLISESVGFDAVNEAVVKNMSAWVGAVVRNHFEQITATRRSEGPETGFNVCI